MGGSALLDARRAWVKHLVNCRQCCLVARGKRSERCQEGQALRDEMLSRIGKLAPE